MEIRQADIKDLEVILVIYEKARRFMAANGNPQWGDDYPFPDMVEQDLKDGKMFFCMEKDQVAAVFCYAIEEEADYAQIDGAWLNDLPYGVVHRLASTGNVKGAAGFCLDWAFKQSGNLRVDTYEKNEPMRHILKQCGFTHCGTIHRIGMEWLAYQKTV